MSIDYLTLSKDNIHVITRDEYRTKDLAVNVAENSIGVSARVLQAVIAYSKYGNETEDDYNLREYDTIREEAKQWTYTEHRYTSLEEVQDLEREYNQRFISSDDEFDLQKPESSLTFVEHIWERK